MTAPSPPTFSTFPSCRRNGFTLIELLVVIGIIAALAAVLFHAGGKAVAAGETARCTSNLRAIGAASAAYLADHNGEFFPRKLDSIFNFVGAGAPERASALDRPLNPYLGVTDLGDPVKVACCPTVKGKTAYGLYGTSYNSNHYNSRGSLLQFDDKGKVIAFPGEPKTWHSIRLSMIERPSRFVVAMEHGAHDMLNANDATFNARDSTLRTHWKDRNRFILLFADGHVAPVDLEHKMVSTDSYTFSFRD